MDYSKIEEPCVVCKIEDELGEERGAMSHPINCGWRVTRTNDGYIKGLDNIINLCLTPYDDLEVLINDIKNTAISTLTHRYDIKEGDV